MGHWGLSKSRSIIIDNLIETIHSLHISRSIFLGEDVSRSLDTVNLYHWHFNSGYMLLMTFLGWNYLQLIYTEIYINEHVEDSRKHYDSTVLAANVFLINQVFYRTWKQRHRRNAREVTNCPLSQMGFPFFLYYRLVISLGLCLRWPWSGWEIPIFLLTDYLLVQIFFV